MISFYGIRNSYNSYTHRDDNKKSLLKLDLKLINNLFILVAFGFTISTAVAFIEIIGFKLLLIYKFRQKQKLHKKF